MSAATSPRLNRTQLAVFLELLDVQLAAATKTGEGLCLLLVQLRNFNDLNLSLGYRAVDSTLAAFASCLSEGLGEQVSCTRIGTKRFAVVLRNVRGESYALLAAKKVERLVADPRVAAFGQRAELGIAQGIALYPVHAATAESLLGAAETALSVAAESGGIAIHSPVAAAKIVELHRIERELMSALENGGIETYFQPQVDIVTGAVHGAEALLRCRDADGALLSPQLVIEAAERAKVIDDVTSAVLNTALRYAADWPSPTHGLSINVSTTNLRSQDLATSVLNAARMWDRYPRTLTVEITESALMEEPSMSFATMRRLRESGVRVAIDDFGTGYSSLSYFKDIPATELKIDKSFVANMSDSDADRRIVQTIVNLAHAFDLKVVAEGVENESGLNVLRTLGCDFAQGYLIGKPMAPVDYLQWVRSFRTGQ